MAIEARIRELDLRHRELDRVIEDEARRPATSDLTLQELKRKKLRLKEEMQALRSGYN